ncbi:MAG: PQQ-binding-like beta-propeller repeat protein [Planctomycetes bacterium]|nr:PQQ-binding-like beta-propeller repeat protein [Planctomycetota bacterium]
MSIKGELKDINLADIFQMVAMQQQEGTLIVSDGETKKWLYFSTGSVSLLSAGKRRPTPLGQLLLRAGKITEKQLDEALAVWRRTGKRLGEVLCDFGLTTQEEIEVVVQGQIAEEIYDLLDWQGTTFEFVPGPPPEDFTHGRGDRRELAFDVNTILLEAARRADEWDKIEQEIGSINEIFVRVQTQGASANLEGDALSVYPLIDGSRTVHDLVEALRLPKTDVGRAMLALQEVGLIRQATLEEILRLISLPRIEEHPERLSRLMELAVSREENLEMRKRLAGVYEDLGRPLDAAHHYRQIAAIQTEQYKLAEAAEALREATRLVPDDTETREQLVELYVRLTNVPHAVLHLKRLAKHHLESNAQAKALAAYRRALELSPYDFECRKQVVDMLLGIRDVDSALEECINLEMSATTQSDREDVRDRYGKLLALAPNLLEARNRLAGLTEVERHHVRLRRGTIRKAIVVVVLLVISAALGGYIYIKQKQWRKRAELVERLRKEGRYEEAQRALHGDSSVEATRYRRLLREQERKEKEDRQREIKRQEQRAKSYVRSGQLFMAAKLYQELANKIADTDAWKATDLRDKASGLEERWQRAENEKRVGEDMVQAGQYKEAHEQFFRMIERSPDICRALGVRLPIYVTSIPPGASLSVNGLPSGEAPRVVYKQPGAPIRISFEKRGHERQTRSVLDDNVWHLDVLLPRVRLWVFQTGGALEGQATCDKGDLYVGSRDGILYVLDELRGDEKWRFKSSDDIMTTPAVADGAVFFGTNDGKVHAIDTQTHSERWSKPFRGFIRSSPVAVKRGEQWVVVFGALDHNVYALEAGTGKPVWSCGLSNPVQTAPCVAGDTLFVCDDGGHIYGLRVSDGVQRWRFKADGQICGGPAWGKDMVFVGSDQGTVYGLEAATGKVKWKFACEGKVIGSCAVGASKVYVCSEDKRVYAIDLQTGKEIWRFCPDAAPSSPPAVAGDALYVGTEDGGFYAVATADGSVRWNAVLEQPTGVAARASDVGVFVGAEDRRIYAFKR